MKKFFTLLLASIMVFSLFFVGTAKADSEDAKVADYLAKEHKVKDFNGEFNKIKESADNLGFKHVKLNQKANGIPVYGGDIIVHINKEGKVYGISGNYNEKAKGFKITGKLMNKKDAIEYAKRAAGFNLNAEDFEINAELNLYEFEGKIVPAYIVDMSYIYPEAYRWKVFIDARDGKLLFKYNNLKTSPAVGTGTGFINDTKQINLDYLNGTYYLRDLTKVKGSIYTNDAKNRNSTKTSIMTDTDTIWNSIYQGPAIDAHFFVGVTYDYYKDRFGRVSYDGTGKDIKVMAHYGKNYVNAFWDGRELVFGDGDGVEFGPFSADMDIVAHEYTHAVGDNEGGLQYSSQSGALEEATADLMSIFALDYYSQKYLGKPGGWLFCANAYTPSTPGDSYYSYVNPEDYGYPHDMSQYLNTTSDNGGVHTNCTIIGHAGYMTANAIGIGKTEQILYRAICNYYTSTTDFSGARAAWLNAAKDLYGLNSTEYNAVAAGFDHVGIK